MAAYPNQLHPMPRYQHPVQHMSMLQQQQQLYNQFFPNNVNNNGFNSNQRQRGPKGPQNLSYNRNTPAGTGAFVPLQAILKSKNSSSNGTTTTTAAPSNATAASKKQPSQLNPAATVFAQKNAEHRQMVEQKQEEVKQSFASFLAAVSSKAETSVISDKTSPSSSSSVPTVEATSDKPETKQVDNVPKAIVQNSSTAAPPKQRQMRIAAKFSQVE